MSKILNFIESHLTSNTHDPTADILINQYIFVCGIV